MLDLTALKSPAPNASPFVRDTDSKNFENDVLTASMKTPVIIDFHATWSAPSKQLTPLLEKLVIEANGAIVMFKVDIDKNPDLAQAMRVQSAPMVYAFFQGQPVDGFVGSKPEPELRAFVEKLKRFSTGVVADAAPEVVDVTAWLLEADKFFIDGKYHDAIASYSTALDAAPDNQDALAGIGWSLVAMKDMEGVSDIAGDLTPEQKKNARLNGLSFLAATKAQAAALEPVDALNAKIAKNAKDLQARYDLAVQSLAALDVEGAIDQLVDLVRRDREWQEQKARGLLVQVFEALGPKHPLTPLGRRKLSTVLFS